VSEHAGTWASFVIKTASCAVGDEVVMLPDDVKPGGLIECHGIKQRVTYEFGAWALEKV